MEDQGNEQVVRQEIEKKQKPKKKKQGAEHLLEGAEAPCQKELPGDLS